MKARAELAIVLTSLIWGSTFPIVKEALRDVSPLTFLAVRFLLAALLMGAIFRSRLSLRFSWRAAVVPSGFLFAGYVLQTIGLRYTSASKSAFLTAVSIVLVPLLAPFVSQVDRSWRELGGAALALAGTALMTSTGAGIHLGFGDLLTIGCAVAFAFHLLSVEYFSRRMSFHSLSVLQVAGVALFAGATCFWAETPRLQPTPSVITAVVVTSVLATALCFSLYTWAQQHTSATRAALLLAMEPVFAGLVAWVWAGETWSRYGIAGAGLILAGIVTVVLKPAPALEHHSG